MFRAGGELSLFAVSRWCLAFGAGLICLGWLLPGHYFPWFTFQQEFAAVIGSCLIGLSLLTVRPAAVRWPWLGVVALVTAAIPLLQWGLGQITFHADAVIASAYLAGFGLAIAAGASLRTTRLELPAILMGALAAAAILAVGMCFMQWLSVGTGAFVDDAPSSARFYANFGQPNNLATALAIGICALLYFHARGTIGSFGTAVAIAFLGFGIVMTQSRTGWLFIALLCLGLLTLRRRANLRVPAWAVVAGAVMFAVAAANWQRLNDVLLLSKQQDATERLAVAGLRPIHWRVMLDAIGQQPLLGYGWNQAILAQQAAVLNHPATGEVLNSSHNIALDLMVWNGVPIGVLLILAVSAWFIRQFRICRSADRAFLLAAVGAVFLHGMLELALEYAFLMLPAALLMGSLDGMDPPAAAPKTQPAVFAVPLVLLAALAAFVGAEYLEVDRTARTMRFVAAGIGTDRVSQAPEPDVVLLDRPKMLHRYMLTRAREDNDPNYLSWMRSVAMRHPMAPAMLRHALAEGLNDRPGEARLVLARLCKMHMAAHCDQGRASWSQLQGQHPKLREIPYPDTPSELLVHRAPVTNQ
jgi:hypothetical protein